jgi:plasmid stabilization system protein ParE
LFDYIAAESSNERAESVLHRIERTPINLSEWPRIGRLRSDLDGSPRAFTTWPWLIVYEPKPSGGGIFVWRIVDGRRDLSRLIQEPK